jgi:uncharacterized protein YraI
MLFLQRALLCIAMTYSGAVSAFAAEVTIRTLNNPDGTSEKHEIVLSGPIVKGDAKRIADIRGQSGAWDVLVLSSPGGDFAEGLAIASYARENLLPTHIRRGDTCASACAFAFLGGSFSEDGTYARRSLEVGAKLLFHAPYVDMGNATVNIQEMVREITDVTIDLNKKFDEFDVPNALRPLLLKNEKDHSFFDATNVESVELLRVSVEGLADEGVVTRSMVMNRCINGWRIGMNQLPSKHRSNDIPSFELWSRESGIKIMNGASGAEIQLQAVDLGEGTSATCSIGRSSSCSFQEDNVSCATPWNSQFLLAVPPDTKLDDVAKVLANYRSKEADLFQTLKPAVGSAPKTESKPKIASVQQSTAFICNTKSAISNIRSGPNSKQFPVVGTFVNGWPVTVIGSQKNPDSGHVWFEVSVGNVRGFIDSDWIVATCDVQRLTSAAPVMVKICNKAANTTNLRAGPNPQNFPVVQVLRNGDQVELFHAVANPVTGHPWYMVRTITASGYVDAEKIGGC